MSLISAGSISLDSTFNAIFWLKKMLKYIISACYVFFKVFLGVAQNVRLPLQKTYYINTNLNEQSCNSIIRHFNKLWKKIPLIF